jgi:hypothetical protein
VPSDLAYGERNWTAGPASYRGLLRWRDPRGGDLPSYDVLVYRDLKTTRSYELGEPVPDLGEGLYIVAVACYCTPAERRPSYSA